MIETIPVRRTVVRTHPQAPPVYLEYAWYVSLTYATVGEPWGVSIPIAGAGLLVILTMACVYYVGDRVFEVYAPASWALCTGIVVIAINYVFYDVYPLGGTLSFVNWICTMLIAHVLLLRPEFFRRFALVAFAIGVCSLPLISVRNVGGIVRAWGAGGMSNPNVLGMWFGFCALFFLFWGLQAKKTIVRASSWAAALGALYIVFLSVSRGAMVGIILACVIGLRSTLKQYFLPFLSVVLVFLVVYASGVFDELIDQFVTRGTVESGREKLWAQGIPRVLDSPWIGVSEDDVKMPLPNGLYTTPHNGLLHIALSAGIGPLICYLIYLARVGAGTLRMMWKMNYAEDLVLPPLVVFGMFQMMVSDYAFMSAWDVVVFALATTRRVPPSLLTKKSN